MQMQKFYFFTVYRMINQTRKSAACVAKVCSYSSTCFRFCVFLFSPWAPFPCTFHSDKLKQMKSVERV